MKTNLSCDIKLSTGFNCYFLYPGKFLSSHYLTLLLFTVSIAAHATTYTWIGPYKDGLSSGSYIADTNWSPARTILSSSDIILFNTAGASVTITNVPAQTIGQFIIANGNISLEAISANTLSTTDLDIMSGCSLTVNNVNIDVNGNWTNDGAFTTSNSTVYFTGSNAIAIVISGNGTNSFYHLELSKTSSINTIATLSTAITVNGNFLCSNSGGASTNFYEVNANMTCNGNVTFTNNGNIKFNSGTFTCNGLFSVGSSNVIFKIMSTAKFKDITVGDYGIFENDIPISNPMTALGDVNILSKTATLVMGNFGNPTIVGSTGRFNFIAGNFYIGHLNGISNDDLIQPGCIRGFSGGRMFGNSDSVTYIYFRASTQFTGTGLPDLVNSLWVGGSINNVSGTPTLSLSKNLTVLKELNFSGCNSLLADCSNHQTSIEGSVAGAKLDFLEKTLTIAGDLIMASNDGSIKGYFKGNAGYLVSTLNIQRSSSSGSWGNDFIVFDPLFAYINNLTINNTNDDKSDQMRLLYSVKVQSNLTLTSGYFAMHPAQTSLVSNTIPNTYGTVISFANLTGGFYYAGQTVIVAHDNDNKFEATVVSYSSGTLTLSSTKSLGSGTYSDWTIYGTSEIHVTNTASNAITYSLSDNSTIKGYLRRNVSSSGTYDFPVGTWSLSPPQGSSYLELATIKLNNQTGISNIITGYWDNFNSTNNESAPAAPNVSMNGMTVNEHLNSGYWIIKPDADLSSGNYDITLQQRGYTNPAISPVDYAIITREPWQYLPGWCSTGTHNNNTQTESGGTVTAVRTAINSLSALGIGADFAVGKLINKLPITLGTLTASIFQDNKVAVKWTTESEINNDYFVVERASPSKYNNDLYFAGIGLVDGAGNSTSRKSYTFIDKQPGNSGTIYYRLKQVDYDDNYVYYGPVSVLLNAAISIKIFPTASSGIFNLQGARGKEISVYTTDGKMILHSSFSNKSFFDLSALPQGIYFVTILTDDQIITERIVKMN